MYRPLALIALLAGSVAFAETAPDAVEPLPDGVLTLTAPQLTELAARVDGLLVVDARLAADRAQGYIEDSISLPNVETDCAALARRIPDRNRPVVFYCNGVRCGRSLDSVQKARACGYTRVFWFRGGFEEWRAEGYPLVKD